MQQMNKHVTVYPRWRGEHSLSSMRNFPRRGLSPLARGTHFLQS
ncbi:hypothetical protein SEETMRM10961_15145 [Salmonella enterica subsp. enterica serovar Typhimurium]|nr:hypothetical protein SEETMRM10961_15145 [Salmonella enterica subsp. enterica serovar Typhimurium]